MATSVDEFRIIRPFLPSLSHLSSVRVAASLSKDFDYHTLKKAFGEVQLNNSIASTENSEENRMSHSGAKKCWLFIPAHLRMGVWEAYIGMENSKFWWRKNHLYVDMNKYHLYLRYDGTIDSIKTAQHLVVNKSISIKRRFVVACEYCLEKSIQVLWTEMEVSVENDDLRIDNFSMTRFWSNRMRYRSQVPWTQTVLDYIESLSSPHVQVRFSSFFCFLQPIERQKVLTYLPCMELDDLRFCLYSLTKDEEEKIMKEEASRVIFLHLWWPLNGLFIETFEKMWKFIDIKTFRNFVIFFFCSRKIKEHLVYLKLFADFWERSPNHLKEYGNEDSVSRRCVDSFLNNIQTSTEVSCNFDSYAELLIDLFCGRLLFPCECLFIKPRWQ